MINYLWLFTSIYIIFISLYLSKKEKLIQFNLKKIFKELLNKNNKTSVSSLFLSLSGKIGVGSISGIAYSIYTSNESVILWIWIISLITSIICYKEAYLGTKNKFKKNNKLFIGPSTYIKNKQLKNIYIILFILTYTIGIISIQSNTISNMININPFLIGIFISIAFLLLIKKQNITRITNILVPLMTIMYLSISLFITIKNINIFPQIINNILKLLKNKETFFITMIIGIKRGIFACESGIGISAYSVDNNNSPKTNGLIQLLGNYIISFIICTSTTIILITSNYKLFSFKNINGIELIIHSIKYHLGNIGIILLFISIFLFAISTIISSYHFVNLNLKMLNINTNILLTIIFIIVITTSTITSPKLLWNITDTLICILTLINIYSIKKESNDS